MKRLLIFGLVLAMSFALAAVAKADTVTDTTLNVTYTATVTGSQVTLTVDATGFTASGTGFLTAVSLQFVGASTVSLVSAPGGVSDWSSPMSGGLDKMGCNGKGGASGSWCIQNVSANLPVPASGTYTFVFNAPGLDSNSSDIKAAYNTASDNSGKNLGLTSQGIGFTPTKPTPEPASILLLGFGLVGAPFLRRRRS